MRITDEHLYHGAALNQIAEHKKFTEINAQTVRGKVSRSAFRVNNLAVVYLKYAKAPNKLGEYQFTFTTKHRRELKAISDLEVDLYVALICVKGREICCISYDEFQEFHRIRVEARGRREAQLVILSTLDTGKAFRVYVNKPSARGLALGQKKIPRNRFPKVLLG